MKAFKYQNGIPISYVGLLILCIKNYFDITWLFTRPEIVDDILSAVILCIFLFVIISKSYSNKEFVYLLLISLVALYSAYVSGLSVIATSVLTIIAFKDESFIEVAQYYLKIKIVILLIHMLFALPMGALGLVDLSYSVNGRYRISLAYGQAGHLADNIINIFSVWIMLHFMRIRKSDFTLIGIVAIFTFVLTDSRTGLIVMSILILGTFILQKTMKMDSIIVFVSKTIIPLLTFFVLSLITVFRNNRPLVNFVDKLLSTRIKLAGYYYDKYGWTLFGRYCDLNDRTFNSFWMSSGSTFDSIYSWFAINLGFIWLVLLSIAFYYISKKCNALICLFFIVWAASAMLDTDFINPACSFTILLISLSFSKKNNNELCERTINND